MAQSASPATVPPIAIATKDDVSLQRTLIPASLRASPRLSETRAPKRRQSAPADPAAPDGLHLTVHQCSESVNHKRSRQKSAGIPCLIAALMDRVAIAQQRRSSGACSSASVQRIKIQNTIATATRRRSTQKAGINFENVSSDWQTQSVSAQNTLLADVVRPRADGGTPRRGTSRTSRRRRWRSRRSTSRRRRHQRDAMSRLPLRDRELFDFVAVFECRPQPSRTHAAACPGFRHVNWVAILLSALQCVRKSHPQKRDGIGP
jgi:hypothetical protein